MSRVAVLVIISTALVSCSLNSSGEESSGRIATEELEKAIQGLVADNGLISVSPIAAEAPADPLVTSVLHPLVSDNRFVETDAQVLGTLQGTYAAARVLEDRTTAIIDEKSRKSMDEVIVLAESTSPADGAVARLMRAAVLEATGDLSDEDKVAAMDGYAGITGIPCPTDRTELCVVAADAASRLEDEAVQITIPVPETFTEGDNSMDELMYKVLAHSWAVKNVDEWVIAAQARGLDPLADVSDSSRPSSVRLWAAAARTVLYPELGTEAEIGVAKGLEGLVSCQGVDGLAVADHSDQSCSVESTYAYYLSGVWGMP